MTYTSIFISALALTLSTPAFAQGGPGSTGGGGGLACVDEKILYDAYTYFKKLNTDAWATLKNGKASFQDAERANKETYRTLELKDLIEKARRAYWSKAAISQIGDFEAQDRFVRALIESGAIPELEILDYWEAKTPLFQVPEIPLFLVPIEKMDGPTAEAFLLSSLNDYPGFKKQVQAMMAALKHPSQWREGEINHINDPNLLPKIPDHCVYVQLAARNDDGVYKNIAYGKHLKPYQEALLSFHETIYWLGKDRLQSSDVVRLLFRWALSSTVQTDNATTARIVERLGFYIEKVTGAKYVSSSGIQKLKTIALEATHSNYVHLFNVQTKIRAGSSSIYSFGPGFEVDGLLAFFSTLSHDMAVFEYNYSAREKVIKRLEEANQQLIKLFEDLGI